MNLAKLWLRHIHRTYSKMSYSTRVLRCDAAAVSFTADEPVITAPETLQFLQLAAQDLRNGETVAFPTETVYGLGALALEPDAASRIFSTKGRPPDNPLIVHVSSPAMLRRILPTGYTLSRIQEVLMRRFWPGPLTLLFPTNPDIVPPIITAGQSTVAIRMPSHPVARALIAMTDAPIAAPSANSSGKPSPTRAEHVLKDLNGKLGLILDGGACGVGLESTVVDTLHEDGNVRILRPGGVTVEDIEKALREEVLESSSIPKVLVHKRDYRDEAIEQAPTTPGMKYRHYSPAVPVVLLHTSTPPTGINQVAVTSYLETLKSRTLDSGRPPKVGLLMASDSPILPIATGVERVTWHVHSLGSADTPAVAAQRLFDGLLTLEGMEVDLILIEELKEEREGLAVMNRVRKAAGESVWVKV